MIRAYKGHAIDGALAARVAAVSLLVSLLVLAFGVMAGAGVFGASGSTGGATVLVLTVAPVVARRVRW